MLFSSVEIGKTYVVQDVIPNNPCLDCLSCIRLRLMELGFHKGSKLKILRHSLGIWVIQFISETNTYEQTLALRDEETLQIILEDN